MTTITPVQAAFSAGEVSPLLYQRHDYQRTRTGMRACNGFIPLRQGAFTRAPGTIFDGYTRGNAAGRLIDFEFAADDALTLEFTPGKLRFWRYGTLVQSGGVPYEIDTPYGADSLPNLQWEQSADVIYLVDGLQAMQKLSRFALTNWTIAPVNHTTGPFRVQNLDKALTIQASAATGTVTLTASAALFEANHIGSLMQLNRVSSPDIPLWTADVEAKTGDRMLYDGKCYVIVSFDGTTGQTGAAEPVFDTMSPPATLVDNFIIWALIAAATYPARANLTAMTLGEKRNFGGHSWEVDSIVSTGSSKKIGVNPPTHDEGDFLAEKGGPVWRYEDDGVGVVRITAVASGTSATATVLRTLPRGVVGQTTYRWAEGAWSARHGWPSALASHDQRLIAAATPADPRTFWASVVGDFEDFTPGIDADDGFAFAVSGQSSLNRILWLASGGAGLHIGALGEEFSTRSSSAETVIGPTTTVIRPDSNIGSRPQRPIVPDGAPIFVSKDGGRVFQMVYSFETDRKRPQELSLPADHLGATGFLEMAWQGAPLRLAWLRRGNGELAAMSYDSSEDVLGWMRLSLAGGHVESMAVTPSADGTADDLTMIVRRVIGGAAVRMVERLSVPWGILTESPVSHANHAFAARVFEPESASDTFAVPHLVGQSVLAWTEAGQFGPFTVPADGNVTLPVLVARPTIGLFDATHVAETLDIQGAAPDGDTLGRRKRLQSRLAIGLHRTVQGHVRAVERDFGQPERPAGESALVAIQVAGALTTDWSGLATVPAPSGTATEVTLRIRPDGLAPLTVTALIPPVSEHGR
jgi:hypothetical protein